MSRSGSLEVLALTILAWTALPGAAEMVCAEPAAEEEHPPDEIAAFSAWFENPDRVANYDIAVCSNFLDQLDRTHALPRYEALPEGFYADLCHLPDGRSCPCGALGSDLRRAE